MSIIPEALLSKTGGPTELAPFLAHLESQTGKAWKAEQADPAYWVVTEGHTVLEVTQHCVVARMTGFSWGQFVVSKEVRSNFVERIAHIGRLVGSEEVIFFPDNGSPVSDIEDWALHDLLTANEIVELMRRDFPELIFGLDWLDSHEVAPDKGHAFDGCFMTTVEKMAPSS
jgi:hypothetical protein